MLFTNAFSINAILSPLTLMSSSILIYYYYSILRIKFNKKSFLFLFLSITSLISTITITISTANYHEYYSQIILYLSPFILFYLAPLFLFTIKKPNLIQLSKSAFFPLLIISIFVIIEFLLKNIFNITIILPRGGVSEFEAMVSILNIYRPRGFMEEPGHLALFISIFLPLSLFYANTLSKKNKVISISIFLSSWLLTFSIASFISATISLLITLLIERKIKFKLNAKSFFLFFIILGITLTFSIPIIEVILNKLNSSSFNDRVEKTFYSLDLIKNGNFFDFIFGLGPGYYIKYDIPSPINLYLNIITGYGISGLTFLLIFITSLTFKAIKLSPLILFALMTSLLHYLFISNIWYPWFWWLASIITYSYKYRKDIL
ncbi:O-antigen polymerase [Proteus faecis]|uniref:O-antigen polymerase n=1 Tax=Proteus faecis TaxID=2050967 RepID=UPI003075C5FB